MSKLLVVLGLLAATALSACGSSSSSSNWCCVNGAYYSCGSAEDTQSCTEKCSRDSSKDDSCK